MEELAHGESATSGGTLSSYWWNPPAIYLNAETNLSKGCLKQVGLVRIMKVC